MRPEAFMAHSLRRSSDVISGRAQAILSEDPAGAGRAVLLMRDHAETVDRVCATAAMRRLRGVDQFGAKRNTVAVPARMVPLSDGRVSEAMPVESLSRFGHSVQVAAVMLAFCARFDVSSDETVHAVVASLCHDLGHSPFSHLLEDLLAEYGCDHHEVVGRRLVREDPELRDALRNHRVDPGKVVSVMREEGDLGAIQSVADTCAYLEHDCRLAGIPLRVRFVWETLRALRGVENGVLLTDEPSRIEAVLDKRAYLYHALHLHPFNQALKAVVSAACGYLLATGMWRPEELQRAEDRAVLDAIRDISSSPSWFASARRILFGEFAEIGAWDVRAFSDEAAALAFVADARHGRPALMIRPVDMTAKTVRVLLPGQAPRALRAVREARPDHHRLWHVLSYAGPV